MKLSVVIPVFNEEATVLQVVEAVRVAALPNGINKEIVVVNDGSTDRTAEMLGRLAGDPAIRVFHQSPNQGKTAAIRRGIAEAAGDFILIQDADLEYDPKEYAKLFAPLLAGQADVVYGSRFLGSIRRMKGVNRWANVISNWTFDLFYGIRLTDINTCFKLFRIQDIRSIKVESDHFAFETEATAKMVRKGLRIAEVPIAYEARSRSQGKKIDWPKALGMYWAIFRFWRG
ncbi:MAG: glycosyltransferase family 2 protein [Candidatus Omnitrophica bacterium]|nr:glycosyltransferase family 2 protein [Candidatus Omnitrophota bacterium]